MSFFEKRTVSPAGRFFADQVGKDTGEFHKKTAAAMAPGQIPPGTGGDMSSSASPTQMATAPTPPPNAAQGAQAGGLYGTGAGCSPGSKPPAPAPVATKVAATSPTDWDYVFPTGFHRPTKEQPEALEAGEERFHDTEAPNADYGTGKGIKQGGVNEGGNFMASILNGAGMGKHADPSITSGEFWRNRAGEAGDSIRSGASEVGNTVGSAISSATSSPLLMTLGAGLLARKGIKGGAKAIKKIRANRAAKTLGQAGEVASAAGKAGGLAGKVSEGAKKIQSFLRR